MQRRTASLALGLKPLGRLELSGPRTLLVVLLLTLTALNLLTSPALGQHRGARHRSSAAAGRRARCATPARRAQSRRNARRHLRRLCRRTKQRSVRTRLLSRGTGAARPKPRARIHPPAATAPAAAPAPAPEHHEDAAATIAAVLATTCTNTEVAPEPQNIEAVREAVLCLINRERATNGEQPLRTNAKLQQAAESHSRECVELDYFAHVSPSGETPVQRIEATGYIPSPQDGYVLGENLAWGTYELGTAQAIVAAWIASPPHLANILEARYAETGIGVTPAVPASRGEGAPGATYAQEFGVILQ